MIRDRRLLRYTAYVFSLILFTWLAFELLLSAVPAPNLVKLNSTSQLVLSREGQILKAYLTDDGYWRLKTTRNDVSKLYLDMLFRYEDRRFYQHPGVDPIAVMRSLYLMVRRGKIVSGASTLTMQAVRLLEKQEPGWAGKVRQAILAIKLERMFDKDAILSIYLTLAPFGGNVEGVRAASLQYFGIEPRQVSPAQAALLVAVPQSPQRRRPRFASADRKEAREAVLRRMANERVIPPWMLSEALKEGIHVNNGMSFLAQHLSDRLRVENSASGEIRTTIRMALQKRIEAIAAEYLSRQHDLSNIAVIVLRNRGMTVEAYMGGGDYFDPNRAGMFDLVRAVRSPGSALKPLIYGIAFEDLIVHPQTIVTDEAIRLQGYAPENFDKKYRGDVTVKDALVLSLNTVAVTLLEAVGPERFLARLRSAGIAIELPSSSASPGLAIALGGFGISLENLATVFAAFANHGQVRHPRYLPAAPEESSRTLVSPEAAWAVLDVLAEAASPPGRIALRSRDGGRRLAYKTGTSYGFKDAWAVGADGDHVVAVWVGRPDAIGRPSETGASSAAPILHRIFDLLPIPDRDVAFARPADSVLAQSVDLPARLRQYAPRAPSAALPAVRAVEIKFPTDGSMLKLAGSKDVAASLTIVTAGGRAPVRVYVDGKLIPDQIGEQKVGWTPQGRGQAQIVAIDADGSQVVSNIWID